MLGCVIFEPRSRHARRRSAIAARWGMSLDLSDDDKAALVELLRDTVDRDRFPLSPRIGKLRAILAKLEPPAPRLPR
jgi:hypothetical protein